MRKVEGVRKRMEELFGWWRKRWGWVEKEDGVFGDAVSIRKVGLSKKMIKIVFLGIIERSAKKKER